MKLNIATDFIEAGNTVERGQFRIKQSPLAFQILSSSLYSDKIGAVLRELGCNAADAHNEVGTPDKPIEVKLPNSLDRTFYVKDYGPGLSHKEICDPEDGLYTTYFASTKNESNRDTGAFGLGSKSPFAYTDQFTVETAQNGEHRVYVAYRDAEGYLSCDLMETKPATDAWPHGLKVSMPVAKTDFKEFHDKAQLIYEFFRILPSIKGSDIKLEARAIEPVFFNLQRATASTTSTNPYASLQPLVVMGNVAYPIDADVLRDKVQTKELDLAIFSLVKTRDLAFDVPIGTITITPSRESIEYTPETIKALVDFIRGEFETAFTQLVAAVNNTSGSIESLLALRGVDSAGDVSFAWFSGFGDASIAGFFRRFFKVLAKRTNIALTDELAGRLRVVLSKEFPIKALLPVEVPKEDIGVLHWQDKKHASKIVRRKPIRADWTTSHFNKLEIVESDCKNAAAIVRYNIKDPDGLLSQKALLVAPEIAALLRSSPFKPPITPCSTLTKPPKKTYPRGAGGKVLRGAHRELDCYELGRTDYDYHALNYGYTPPRLPISEVPKDKRAFIVRFANYGRRNWTSATALNGDAHYIGRYGRNPLSVFNDIDAVRQKLPELNLPSHVFVLTESKRNAKNFELETVYGFRPLIDFVVPTLEVIRTEVQQLQARLASLKPTTASNAALHQLLTSDEYTPCDSADANCVFRLFRFFYQDPKLQRLLFDSLDPASDFLVLWNRLRLSEPDAGVPDSQFEADEARYKQLVDAFSTLYHDVRGVRALDNAQTQRSSYTKQAVAAQKFTTIARDYAALSNLAQVLSCIGVDEKVGRDRLARMLIAGLSYHD